MHGTRSMALRALILALGLMALGVSPAFAAKDVFIRTKPHVNVGTIQGKPVEIWFHAVAGLFDDGDAVGILQLRLRGGESFVFRVTGGQAVVERNAVAEVVLAVERVGRGGASVGESDLVIIRPSSTAADCLIYDFVGPEIHLESEGQLTLRK